MLQKNMVGEGTPPPHQTTRQQLQYSLADLDKLLTGESKAHSATCPPGRSHSATRHRLQFKFWLDTTKKQDDDLALELFALKQDRQYTPTIRDGVRLILDLRRGRLTVLRELFPWVIE